MLLISCSVALLLACVVRAARPGHLLGFLLPAWEWWLVYRPGWLPAKPTGACAYCTAFWVPGLPAAVATGLLTPAGWWAVLVAPFSAYLFEYLISRHAHD
ncbi:hypothetical protein GCM10023186_45290 [Hymenobacter koreensis]|uniref:DUF1360 domain-containing protein n=1 Tax=Hymenobacter koreensis TaxID=1084523 RepID=A0ABP8JNC6_9BACT